MIIQYEDPVMKCGECNQPLKEDNKVTVMQIRGMNVVLVHNNCLKDYMKRVKSNEGQHDILGICHFCLKPVLATHKLHAYTRYPDGQKVAGSVIPSDGNGIIVHCFHEDCSRPEGKAILDSVKDVF